MDDRDIEAFEGVGRFEAEFAHAFRAQQRIVAADDCAAPFELAQEVDGVRVESDGDVRAEGESEDQHTLASEAAHEFGGPVDYVAGHGVIHVAAEG